MTPDVHPAAPPSPVNGVVLFGPGEGPQPGGEWWTRVGSLTGSPVTELRGPWGWALRSTSTDDVDDLRERLAGWGTPDGALDAAVVPAPLVQAAPGLVVTDVDSTLTTTEAIDLLADEAGAGHAVAEVTERAMRGELDFEASLHQRVATLAGLPVDRVAAVTERVQLSPGARDLVAAVHAWDGRVAVVSGGFTELVDPLARQLGLDDALANDLEVAEGRLTGRVRGEVVGPRTKSEVLAQWAHRWSVPLEATVAVGDGANDLPMLAAAGLGVAYCATSVVREQADVSIGFPRLDAVLALVSPWS